MVHKDMDLVHNVHKVLIHKCLVHKEWNKIELDSREKMEYSRSSGESNYQQREKENVSRKMKNDFIIDFGNGHFISHNPPAGITAHKAHADITVMDATPETNVNADITIMDVTPETNVNADITSHHMTVVTVHGGHPPLQMTASDIPEESDDNRKRRELSKRMAKLRDAYARSCGFGQYTPMY